MTAVQDFSSTLSRIKALGAKAAPGVSSRARVEIIVDGAVAASRELAEGVYRIGARADCDLVLPDAASAHIATLKVEKNAKGQWSVSVAPFIDGMTIDGSVVAAFNPVVIVNPATLVTGATTLRITPRGSFGPIGSLGSLEAIGAFGGNKAATEGAPARKTGVPAMSTARMLKSLPARSILLVAGVLFLAALASSFWDVMKSSSGMRGTPAAQLDEPRIDDQADVIQAIRKQLQVADLADHIKVHAEGKFVMLEGAITERQEERYRSLLSAMRRRTSVDLRSQVRPISSPGQMQIAGVAIEPTPYIILADGQRYQIGDTLPQGWQVESVSAKNVVLSRSGLRETIPLEVR